LLIAEQCARIALVLAPNPQANVTSREQAIARKTERRMIASEFSGCLPVVLAERREISDLDAIIVGRHSTLDFNLLRRLEIYLFQDTGANRKVRGLRLN
jgi:hypothetical protein